MKTWIKAATALSLMAGLSAWAEVAPNHIQLATSSATEAGKWYAEHLDCTAVPEQPNAMDCAGMRIMFVERPSIGSSQGTGINHISFSYADVNAKMAELEAVGVRGSGVRLQRFDDGSTVQQLPGMFEHGFIFDPWGTRIELIEDPALTGFHHIHLESTDPAAALDWYATMTGGQLSQYRPNVSGIKLDGVWLLVDPYAEERPARTDERAIDHLAFVAGDIDAQVTRLKAAGVNTQAPAVPENARSNARRAYLAGPDGVLLALVEPGWQGIETIAATADKPQPVADASYTAPRTPWGTPDLQGIWTANAAHGIPLERPEDVDADALSVTEAAARRERGTLGSIWGYEREWRDTTLGYDKNAPSRQVAMIIDPPDGRMPSMTEKGLAAVAAVAEARANPQLAGGPEDLTNYVRCITRGLPSLMMPSIYNNGLQIVQSPGYVAVQKEMIHETRVIPTSDKPHLGPELKQWLGSSRGYWDGDTLVVEVRNFNGRAPYQGAGEEMRLTERYTRVGENKLRYEFTVDDPTIWTAPWTGMFHFDKDDAQYDLVEYACHEGNYGMFNILSAARAKEKQNAESAGGK